MYIFNKTIWYIHINKSNCFCYSTQLLLPSDLFARKTEVHFFVILLMWKMFTSTFDVLLYMVLILTDKDAHQDIFFMEIKNYIHYFIYQVLRHKYNCVSQQSGTIKWMLDPADDQIWSLYLQLYTISRYFKVSSHGSV